MKKTLTILTLVVMLAVLIVPAAVAGVEAAAVCSHPSVYVASEAVVGPRYYSNAQHGYAKQQIVKCVACYETVATTYSQWANLSSHSTSGGMNDAGHNATNGTHTYQGICNVCAGSYTITRSCSGPPCFVY